MTISLIDTRLVSLHRQKRRYDDEPITPEYVERRFEEAMTVLFCLPASGCKPMGFKCNLPDVVRSLSELGWLDSEDNRPPLPEAWEISRMDETLSWLEHIPVQRHSPHGGVVLRKLVALRAITNHRTGRHVYSWTRLSRDFKAHRTSLIRWYNEAISIITKSLLNNL